MLLVPNDYQDFATTVSYFRVARGGTLRVKLADHSIQVLSVSDGGQVSLPVRRIYEHGTSASGFQTEQFYPPSSPNADTPVAYAPSVKEVPSGVQGLVGGPQDNCVFNLPDNSVGDYLVVWTIVLTNGGAIPSFTVPPGWTMLVSSTGAGYGIFMFGKVSTGHEATLTMPCSFDLQGFLYVGYNPGRGLLEDVAFGPVSGTPGTSFDSPSLEALGSNRTLLTAALFGPSATTLTLPSAVKYQVENGPNSNPDQVVILTVGVEKVDAGPTPVRTALSDLPCTGGLVSLLLKPSI